MRKLTIFFVLAMMLSATPALADRISVVTGILPVQYFVEQIGGKQVQVTALVEPGADPHTYEPKPSQMRAVAGADMFLTIGTEFERNWISRFKSANKDLRVFRLDRGIKKIPMVAHGHHHDGEHHEEHAEEHHENGEHHGEEGHEHGHHHHGGMDPHIWTSPELVKRIADNILIALVKVDPDHEAAYHANHKLFIAKVDALIDELHDTLSGVPRNAMFMVYHPSWGYFAREFHLVQVPVELEGKAPGPRQLAELIEHAKEHDIKVVFVQPQFSERSARTIAKAIHGEVVKIDPLAYNWYANLRRVGLAFRDALAK